VGDSSSDEAGVLRDRPAVVDDDLTFSNDYVRLNIVRVARLQNALDRLTAAIGDAGTELAAMKAEHDPLASHIFISRRNYRNVKDAKGGKRREINARLSFNTACELGFRGSLDEWERLMGAVARR
jgi:hypothetical protein